MSDDFIREERKWSREEQDRADQRRARDQEALTERLGYLAMTVGAITVAALIVFGIWRLVATVTENSTRRNIACVESGGSLITLGGANGEKVCAKVSVEVPK